MASKKRKAAGVGRPRVYISYTGRTSGLGRKVLRLAEKLRDAGIDSRIDTFHGKSRHGFTPPPPLPDREAWDSWQEEQVRFADRVTLTNWPGSLRRTAIQSRLC